MIYSSELNSYLASVAPSGVFFSGDATTAYYERMLFQRAMSVFKWEIPKTWDYSYFVGVLSVCGYLPILDTGRFVGKGSPKDFGIIPQYGTVYGFDIFYQPREVSCSSPIIQLYNLKIGEEVEILRLTPDWCGIWDIIHTYAEMLSMCNKAAEMSLINSNISHVIAARDKQSANLIKEIYNKVSKGEPLVVYEDRALRKNVDETHPEPWDTFTRNVKESYVSNLALEDYETVLSLFDEEVGIANLRGGSAVKKERLNTAEIQVNNIATKSRLRTWCDIIDTSLEKVKTLYPDLKLSYTLRTEERENADKNDTSGMA